MWNLISSARGILWHNTLSFSITRRGLSQTCKHSSFYAHRNNIIIYVTTINIMLNWNLCILCVQCYFWCSSRILRCSTYFQYVLKIISILSVQTDYILLMKFNCFALSGLDKIIELLQNDLENLGNWYH